MRKFIDLALAATLASTAPALADSKSAAEFALNTCLAGDGRPCEGRSHCAGTQLDQSILTDSDGQRVPIKVGGGAGGGQISCVGRDHDAHSAP